METKTEKPVLSDVVMTKLPNGDYKVNIFWRDKTSNLTIAEKSYEVPKNHIRSLRLAVGDDAMVLAWQQEHKNYTYVMSDNKTEKEIENKAEEKNYEDVMQEVVQPKSFRDLLHEDFRSRMPKMDWSIDTGGTITGLMPPVKICVGVDSTGIYNVVLLLEKSPKSDDAVRYSLATEFKALRITPAHGAALNATAVQRVVSRQLQTWLKVSELVQMTGITEDFFRNGLPPLPEEKKEEPVKKETIRLML
jgi:hypothetical protein